MESNQRISVIPKWQPKKLDLGLAAFFALLLPIVAGLLYGWTGALLHMILIDSAFLIGVFITHARWRACYFLSGICKIDDLYQISGNMLLIHSQEMQNEYK